MFEHLGSGNAQLGGGTRSVIVDLSRQGAVVRFVDPIGQL